MNGFRDQDQMIDQLDGILSIQFLDNRNRIRAGMVQTGIGTTLMERETRADGYPAAVGWITTTILLLGELLLELLLLAPAISSTELSDSCHRLPLRFGPRSQRMQSFHSRVGPR
jgi:hypothetical protein